MFLMKKRFDKVRPYSVTKFNATDFIIDYGVLYKNYYQIQARIYSVYSIPSYLSAKTYYRLDSMNNSKYISFFSSIMLEIVVSTLKLPALKIKRAYAWLDISLITRKFTLRNSK